VSSRAVGKKVVWARRVVQAACLCLFLFLFWAAGLGEDEEASPWLRAFFDVDPLVLIATWLSAHELPAAFLFAFITLGATVLLGRVFCGWVCPLGTLHNMVSWLRTRRRRRRDAGDQWSPWQRAKYLLLVVLLVMALFGAHWIGVFDPLCLFYRSLATAVYPGAQYAVEDAATAVYQSDPHLGPLHATALTEPAYGFLRDHVFARERGAFRGAGLIFALFVGIVVLNVYRPRFWCRYVCPLGALLGLCAKRPALRLVTEGCTECGRCAMKCPAAASPDKPGHWRSTECFGCWNCIAACDQDAITFKLKSPFPAPSEAKLDLSRRAVLSAGLGGVGGVILLRQSPEAQALIYNPELIRPPGARPEREFLQRCLKCGLCMKACPTNALHPTGLEAGLEGVWTPRLVPRVGYCAYNCNLCGQVCPTEAIEPLPLKEKQAIRIGLATIDRARCLPYAYDRTCLICEEHCPVSPKAIFFVTADVQTSDGRTRQLKQPHVEPDRCTGCGICEHVCVFKDRPAIRVTSANEARHSGNRAILPGPSQFEDADVEGAPESPYGQSDGNPYQ